MIAAHIHRPLDSHTHRVEFSRYRHRALAIEGSHGVSLAGARAGQLAALCSGLGRRSASLVAPPAVIRPHPAVSNGAANGASSAIFRSTETGERRITKTIAQRAPRGQRRGTGVTERATP
jgi:hypothetical protein